MPRDKLNEVRILRETFWKFYHRMRNSDIRVITVAAQIPDSQTADRYIVNLIKVCDDILLSRVYYTTLKDGATYKVVMRLKLHRYPCLGTGWTFKCPKCGSEPHYVENKKSCGTCKPIIMGISADMVRWADHEEAKRG